MNAKAKDPTPPPPPQSKRRSPTDVQRDRLMDRINRLRTECTESIFDAVEDIEKNAAAELAERSRKAKDRIEARFAARIAPLQAMLSALTPAAPGKDA